MALQEIRCGGNQLEADGVRVLGPHLVCLHSLQRFSLDDAELLTDGAQCLGSHLTCLTSLQTLGLMGNGLDAEALTALEPHIASVTSLRQLDLRYNEVENSAGAAALARLIARLTCLHSLNLRHNYLCLDAAEVIGAHLVSLTSLTFLSLQLCTDGLVGSSLWDNLRQIRDSLHFSAATWPLCVFLERGRRTRVMTPPFLPHRHSESCVS
jgi:Ran GTPase-activating protein (RanGAP) involved in mRNA processing and transport